MNDKGARERSLEIAVESLKRVSKMGLDNHISLAVAIAADALAEIKREFYVNPKA